MTKLDFANAYSECAKDTLPGTDVTRLGEGKCVLDIQWYLQWNTRAEEITCFQPWKLCSVLSVTVVL